ncbi:MAG: serine/threonine protein kinase [Acidobacteria bacterium]|nr:serine/threonine protein kinase [Acidobacteriota bacterium]
MSTGSIERAALELLSRALDVPSDVRVEWVRANCNGDVAVESRVLALLEAERAHPGALKTGGAGHDASDAPIPERIGAYKVVGTIGQGGMGAVYKAERVSGNFDQTVAIKVIRPGVLSDVLVERFQRERQILAALNHPNIARLYDGGEMDDGSPFMIMELVDGLPVLTWAEQTSASLDARLDLFAKLCAAVQFAHQNLIIHRDITPSNVLVSREGEVKLIDFGISRPPERAGSTSVSPGRSGKLPSLSYTPGYAAPERLDGAMATTLSDIFSLGKLLDDLVPGKDQSPEMRAIVACACAADPADRYPSVDALDDDLKSLRAGRPVSAYRGGSGYRFAKFISRHKVTALAVAGVVLGLSAALTVTLLQYNRAEKALALANARFTQARELSRTLVFDVYDKADEIAGSLEARQALAGVVRDYINGLELDQEAPTDVLLEVGIITSRLADLYGGVGIANLGDTETSRQLFLDAEATLDEVIARDPTDTIAIAEQIMVERMLTMQFVYHVRYLEKARLHNARGFELAEQGLALKDENEQRVLRHFWSLRTDLLQILENEGKRDEALKNVAQWRAEITPEMSERMGGGEEMAAYLAMQHATTLIGMDRGAEAIEPLDFAIDFRKRALAETPESYYHMTQLMVAEGEHATASRLAGNLEDAALHADNAVEMARKILADDPEDAGGPEGLSAMLQKRATAQWALGNLPEARAAIEEAAQLLIDLGKLVPGNEFYEANLLHVASQAAEIDPPADARSWACGVISRVRASFDVEARLADPEFVPDRTGLKAYLEADCPA